jgi:glycosyltransferase involved in cell wall biosynthesis
MKIGFDVSQTGERKAGCGFYADGLLKALVEIDQENEYLLYPSFGDFYFDPRLKPSIPKGASNVTVALQHKNRNEAEAFWRSPPLTFEADLGYPNIVHSNNFYVPTRLSRARSVYTLYDLSFLENHTWTTEENRYGCFKGVFQAATHADWIVAISRHTLGRFLDFFPHFPRDRTSVIYPASRFAEAGGEKLKPYPGLVRRGYWLSVGTVEPRKNHLTLLRAYALLTTRRQNPGPLVIAGGEGWLIKDLRKQLSDLGLQRQVHLVGYVDDSTLRWLYTNALCHVFVSLYEGFGMPVLESMSCGTPVIASRSSSIPEIVGWDQACGLLVDPESPEDICCAMEKLCDQTSFVESMASEASARTQNFSWRRSATQLREIYEAVASRGKAWAPNNA